MLNRLLAVALLCSGATVILAQDRETKVRGDRELFAGDVRWIYNDLPKAFAEAEKSGKPLLVAMRCIPCEACSQFDKQIIAGEEKLNSLLKKFVCVRVVQTNGLDLSLFQFDYDQSFHVLVLNADKTIYGRFGTRSPRPEHEDMTLEGLRESLTAALDLHANYPANRAALAAKTGGKPLFPAPEQFPTLKGKYTSQLNYEGKVVQSCIHCHQIRDAERAYYRDRNEPLPDRVVFPYPLPDTVGMRLDGAHRARIMEVTKDSAAAKAGLQVGDDLVSLAGQPLISPADAQWVLHQAPDKGELAVTYRRGDETRQAKFTLDEGWRRRGNLSWRPTTWELRALATGGINLETPPDGERGGVPEGKLALRAKHVGQFGRHALAKQAGFVKGDILVAIDGDDSPRTETELLAKMLALPKGSKLPVTVLRGDKRLELHLPTQ